MSATPVSLDITAETFSEAVLENSHRIPVLVDFWAPWCGPCKTLLPMLEQLATAYHGQFLLAKVNVDEQQQLANQFGVRSVPTVKLFRNGALADEFTGALPESQLRAFIDRHVEKESDRFVAAAHQAMNAGDAAQAEKLLQQLLAQEPHHPQGLLALAELYLGQGQIAPAKKLLDTLPTDMALEPTAQALSARLVFFETATQAAPREQLIQRLAANSRDSAARYQLAALDVSAQDYASALELLLGLLQTDRAYGDDAGRKGMLQIFDLLGGSGELVDKYRRLMFNAMH